MADVRDPARDASARRLSPSVAVAVAAITAVAAFGQTVAGFGFSLLAVAPLGLVIDPKDAVAVAVLLLILNSALVTWSERSHIDWQATRSLLLAAVPGLPLGLAVLAAVSISVLRVSLAVATFAAVTALARGWTPGRRSTVVDAAAGFLTGFLTTSLNTNGPPAVFALQSRGLGPEQFRPTTSAVLGLASAVGAVMFVVAGRVTSDVLQAAVVAVPGLLGGWLTGVRLRGLVPPQRFRVGVLALLLVAAIVTLVAAFVD